MFYYNLIKRALYTKASTHFSKISPSTVLIMRNFSEEICEENQKHFTYNIFFLNPAIYEIISKILYRRAGHR
jgi:hypothetical protein